MAATVEISETNGAIGAPAVTDGIANINFGGADIPALTPATHPVVLSVAAATYSYAKWLRLHVSNMGGSANIGGIQVYKSSGVYVTQEWISTNVSNAGTYPTWSVTTYGHSIWGSGSDTSVVLAPPLTDASANATGIWNSAHSGFAGGFASTNTKILTSAPGATNLTVAASTSTNIVAPGYSDYAVMSLHVDGSAGTPSGAVNQKVITFQYNES